MALTYKKSGVDVPGIEQSREAIGRLVASTHRGLRDATRTVHGFGHYAGIVEIPGGRLLATHTDGVGTKVLVAGMMEKYGTVGIDCVAMNVNDIVCTGATPVSFVDYIAANRNDRQAFSSIMRGLVRGAKRARVPIVGGETAIMPGVIRGGDRKGFAFDLAGTVTGLVGRRQLILGDRIRPGDVIVGANSTGLHSNGYSLAREALLKKRYSVHDRVRGVGRIGDALLKPTEIYVEPVLEAARRCRGITGLAHITGGAFTKLLRLKRAAYRIDSLPRIPPIMGLVQEQGVAPEEMYRTFNMGVGFCVIARADDAGEVISVFKGHGIASRQIGTVEAGRPGVFVGSVRIA